MDLEFLQAERILQRSSMIFKGSGQGSDILRKSHVGAFSELDKEAPGQWALGRGVNSLSFEDTDVVEGRGLLFDLHSVIPIPGRAVPLADILEFKHRRRPELLRLRSALEKIYQEILNAPDKALAETGSILELDQAIADHIRVARETKFPLKLSGSKAKLDWGVAAGIITTFESNSAHLPLTSALVASAGAVAAASLATTIGLRERRDRKTPFEYVIQIDKEFG